MLTFSHPGRGFQRRDFLRVGALGLGGLSLADLLAARAAAASATSAVTGKSIIFLHMHGGPSQFETFDPKMEAPDGIRSTTGAVRTSLPGVLFGSTFLRLARLADRIAVVRSYVPGYDHSASPIINRETRGANVGSYFGRVVGLNHPTTGVPTNMLLTPKAVAADASALAGPGAETFGQTGPLGSAYAPVMPGAGGGMLRDMRLAIAPHQLHDRRTLLAHLDDLRREVDGSGAMETVDRSREQAFDVILRGVGRAFDLSQEEPRVLARYDTAPLLNVDAIRRNLGNYRFYIDHARSIGKLLLLARRLCEAGAGFVSVVTNFVWDMHADGNNAPPAEAMPYVGRPFDHAVSALVEDLEARGLSDRILLVCCGEMGRTPRVNGAGGRDHWPAHGPLLFAGGGLRMGQVIGRSSADGGRPASEPVHLQNLYATLMQTLFNVGEVRLIRGLGADVTRFITEGEPISQLMP
ncbi:MAG: DUF1501 domain-containing protein [Gemmataceae bacterium]